MTGVQTCALPILNGIIIPVLSGPRASRIRDGRTTALGPMERITKASELQIQVDQQIYSYEKD